MLVRTLPAASRMAGRVKFSEAMSSMWFCWRSFSSWIAEKTSGSSVCKGSLVRVPKMVGVSVIVEYKFLND